MRQLARLALAEIWKDEIFDRAAALSYYFVFALFPTLLFLTTLFGMGPGRAVMDRLVAVIQDVLPPDAASLVRRTLAEIQRGAHGGLLSVGAAAALWGASRGMVSISNTLNVVYGVTSRRPWWRQQAAAVLLTVIFSILALAAMISFVFGERIGRAVAAWAGYGTVFTTVWSVLQWPVGLLFVLTGIDLVYHLAPAVRQRWYWLTPGSVFAGIAWTVASLGLRVYVSRFTNYNATYGSIGGGILLLLWLYLSGLALLIGGEINSVVARAAAERGDEIAVPLDEPGADERPAS